MGRVGGEDELTRERLSQNGHDKIATRLFKRTLRLIGALAPRGEGPRHYFDFPILEASQEFEVPLAIIICVATPRRLTTPSRQLIDHSV